MKKTYTGYCHCKRIKFEIDAVIDHVRECDCSLCSQRGALIFRVPEDCFRLQNPLSDLTRYQWNTKMAADYFCPNCGMLPFRKPRTLTEKELESGMTPFLGGWAINVRCLEGIDISALPRKAVHGSRLDIIIPRSQ